MFIDFLFCYDELLYVILIDFFFGYVYNFIINGVMIMSFDLFYIDFNYLNFGEGIFIFDLLGEYVLELFIGDCIVFFELVIVLEIIIDFFSIYVVCDGVFEEICLFSGFDYIY